MEQDQQRHLALSMLKDLMAECEVLEIPLVLIRHHDMTPDTAYIGDVDFLLPVHFRKRLLRLLLRLSSMHGVSFSINQIKKPKLVVYIEESQSQRIKLELWSHLDVRDPKHRTMRYIEWDSLAPHIQKTSSGLRLAPRVEFLYYLSHLYSKNKDLSRQEVQCRLSHYGICGRQCEETLLLLDSLEKTGSTESAAIEANSMLCEMGVLAYRRTIALWFRDVAHAWLDHLHAKRLFRNAQVRPVAVMGPDGSGKTTFIEGFCSMDAHRIRRTYVFKWLFRHSFLYKICYPLMLKVLTFRCKKKVRRNQVDDYFSGVMFLIALFRYSQLQTRAFLVGRYILDRYYYDLLMKNMRFSDRENSLSKWWKIALFFIPRPSWTIQLDADSLYICERKSGIGKNDVDDMRKWLFEFYLASPSPWYSYINTMKSPKDNLKSVQHIAAKLPCYLELKDRLTGPSEHGCA